MGESDVHELALTESIISGVRERVGARKVTRVIVEVGRLAGVVADSLQFFFAACIEGTSLEGATLELIEIPGEARCRQCGRSVAANDFLLECDCGSVDVELLRGQELLVKAVEVI
jgi:hydrogenase nickel incorporation protein HypA/HybF